MSKKLEIYTLYPSTNPVKKWDIYVPNDKTGKIKKVSFGASDYEDYTEHHDKERRRLYRARHSVDNIDDPLSSGFWSYHVLWGDSTDIDENLENVLYDYNLY